MKKFFWTTLIILILFVFVFFSFFYRIWKVEKTTENQMIDKVKDTLPLMKQVDQVHYFSGDQTYYVMLGKDVVGDKLMVWVNQNEMRYRYLPKYLTEEQIKELIKQTEKNITIERITPGVIDQERLIYEVLFEDKEKRLGYLYYDLQTGEFIKKYRLGVTSRN